MRKASEVGEAGGCGRRLGRRIAGWPALGSGLAGVEMAGRVCVSGFAMCKVVAQFAGVGQRRGSA